MNDSKCEVEYRLVTLNVPPKALQNSTPLSLGVFGTFYQLEQSQSIFSGQIISLAAEGHNMAAPKAARYNYKGAAGEPTIDIPPLVGFSD